MDAEDYPEGYELQGEGSMERVEETDTAVLFGRLGDELQMLVQRYCVPPMELEELFQVCRGIPTIPHRERYIFAIEDSSHHR